jgi:hypothetical protein
MELKIERFYERRRLRFCQTEYPIAPISRSRIKSPPERLIAAVV